MTNDWLLLSFSLQDTITYTMETTSNEGEYFFLNSKTGELFLIKSVKNLPPQQGPFTVRITYVNIGQHFSHVCVLSFYLIAQLFILSF